MTATHMTDEELKAKARELGVSEDRFEAPEYPDFRDEKGYKLTVIAAENLTSPKGASQVQLSVTALDEDNNLVKYARSKLWLTYPFDNEQFKFKDKDAFERAFNDMKTLLLCGGDVARYADYVKKVQQGNKAHYYDADGNELVNPAWKAYKRQIRINILTELRAREQNAARWLGTVFYAQRKYNEKDGVVYRNWQRISAQPSDKITYILHGPQMLSRPGSNDALQDSNAEDLF